VIDKIQDLDDNYLSIIRGDWDIQYIEEAKGPVVNMDYFSVDITQLPLNPETGQRFTLEGFFNYVRTNLDTFFENNSTEFGPYNDDEEAIWNSSNYLGAIMRFDIMVQEIFGQELTQDGSVICSEQSLLGWTFTTIKSPEDWSHPVSGNREFGLQLDTDGSYNFFTRGVDRVADKEDVLIGSLPAVPTAFEGADELWNAFQDNLESFISTNDGQAHKLPSQIDRPDWDKVRDVLEGSRPITDLGCE
jgi:hypothetical protein